MKRGLILTSPLEENRRQIGEWNNILTSPLEENRRLIDEWNNIQRVKVEETDQDGRRE